MSRISAASSRRDFLRSTLAPGFLLALTPFKSSAVSMIASKAASLPLYFTEITGLGPELPTATILERFTPLHPELELPTDRMPNRKSAAIKTALQNAFHKSGLPWKEHYEVAFSYQHYGVPDQSRELAELVRYSEAATNYLKSRYTGLFTPKIQWQLLPEHYPIENDRFAGYVGRFTYHLVKAYVSNIDMDEPAPYLAHAQPIERAINYIQGGKQETPSAGTIFLVPGISSMMAPFSELIHLSFHASAQAQISELSKTMDAGAARQHVRNVTESLVESLSYSIAESFMHDIEHTEKLPTIKYMADNLAAKFSYMPQITRTIKARGVQSVINEVQDDMTDFIAQFDHG